MKTSVFSRLGYPSLVFAILNILDYTLTALLIQLGLAYEGNPLLGETVLDIGLTKLALTAAVVAFLSNRKGVMKGVNIGLALIVLWNLLLLILGLSFQGGFEV